MMAGQLDLLDLLADPAPVNDPFYRCKCGSEFPCSGPMAELAVWAEKHREHEEEFSATQWPAGVCSHCGEMYWIPTEHPYWTFERLRDEHREVEPHVCGRMDEVRDMHEQCFSGTGSAPRPGMEDLQRKKYLMPSRIPLEGPPGLGQHPVNCGQLQQIHIHRNIPIGERIRFASTNDLKAQNDGGHSEPHCYDIEPFKPSNEYLSRPGRVIAEIHR